MLVRVLLALYALVVLIGYVYAVFNNPSVVDVSETPAPRPTVVAPENIVR